MGDCHHKRTYSAHHEHESDLTDCRVGKDPFNIRLRQ